MAYVPNSGSVVAFQSDPTKLQMVGSVAVTNPLFIAGSVATIATPVANQSVSGAVSISNLPLNQNVSGSVVAFLGGSTNASVITVTPNQSVSGTVNVGNFPTTQNISGSVFAVGSVTALQGTNPWTVTGFPTTQNVSGSVFATGSVTALQGTNPFIVQLTSGSILSATGNSSVVVVSAVPYSVAALQATNPWIVSNTSVAVMSVVPHSVATLQGTNPWVVANSSVMLTTGTNVIGSVAALQGTNPWIVGNSSVMLTQGINTIGSVATLQGTNPWHVTGSVLAVPSQGASIVGTYTEDTAHTTGSMGLLTLGVRNDTMASITTATNEYSPISVGPIGETVIANAPINRWVTAVASNFTGIEQPVIAAGGASIFTYVTSGQFTNQSANASRLTLRGSAGGTPLAIIVIPANSGHMAVFSNPLKSLANAAVTSSVSAVSSVYVSLQGFRSNFDV